MWALEEISLASVFHFFSFFFPFVGQLLEF